MEMADFQDRRQSGDRREYSVGTLVQCLISPRRSGGRRSSDRRYPLLDYFDSGVVSLAVALMILSIMDATFTLELLSRGGTELNPFMNALLQHSVWSFAIFKMILTGVPAVVLSATGNLLLFNRWRARSVLAALVGLYGGLIVYEIALLLIS